MARPRAAMADAVDKHCPGCDENKPLAAFQVDRRMRLGRQSYCRTCKSLRMRQRYQSLCQGRNAPDGTAGARPTVYGTSPAEYRWLLANKADPALCPPAIRLQSPDVPEARPFRRLD